MLAEFKRRKINLEKSLGEILKSARRKKEITLERAEEETKVRVKYLKALEEGRFEALPGNVYALGFLSKYADFLELNKDELMTRFRSERGETQYSAGLMPLRRIKEPLLYLSSKTLIVTVIVLVLAGILGYIIYSVRAFTLPPNLLISSPSAEQVLTQNTVDIIGKTDEGVTLMINDQTILLDGNGNFTQQVKLNAGLNVFEVKAISRLKKEKIVQVKILAQF